jgi:hypothetical protein
MPLYGDRASWSELLSPEAGSGENFHVRQEWSNNPPLDSGIYLPLESILFLLLP